MPEGDAALYEEPGERAGRPDAPAESAPAGGFDDAATVLGTDYAGVLVRDGWAPYRCYDGLHQTCLNHLLQRCKHLREDYPDNPWAGEVQAVLQAGLDLRDRCNAGELSEHGMATARGRLNARLGRLIATARVARNAQSDRSSASPTFATGC